MTVEGRIRPARPEDKPALHAIHDGPCLQALALSDKGRKAQGSVACARALAELS
jgi:hypothetical protein